LAPTLRPGDVVVLDNLSAHKVKGVRATIEAAAAQLRYLPP
jgi:transposase